MERSRNLNNEEPKKFSQEQIRVQCEVCGKTAFKSITHTITPLGMLVSWYIVCGHCGNFDPGGYAYTDASPN